MNSFDYKKILIVILNFLKKMHKILKIDNFCQQKYFLIFRLTIDPVGLEIERQSHRLQLRVSRTLILRVNGPS